MKKTHVILTVSGNHYFLNKKQTEKLFSLRGKNATIEIDGQTIMVRRISEIMTIDEYYRNHPEKRVPDYKRLEQMGLGIIKKARNNKKAIIGMKKGLESYVNSAMYQGTENAIKLIDFANKRLAEIDKEC